MRLARGVSTVRLLRVLGFIAATLPHALYAQADATKEEHPIVEQVVFKGVKLVEAHKLQATLSTQPTRCHAFFLKPLCMLTHNHLFEARSNLDHDQLRRDVLRIKVFYWLRGYRHTQVDTVVAEKGRGVSVTFNVNEGPPTTIASLDLRQSRQLLSERSLRRYGLPKVGDAIDLTRLDTLHTRVRRTLWDRGYGNAEVRDTASLLDSLHVALNVFIDAGPITTVDTVRIEGNEKVSDHTVERLIGLRRGDLYKRGDLLEGQRRLYRSDLFRQSLITVPDSADSAKTVVVTLREAGLHAFQIGGGFNTVEFGQLQGNLTLYNFGGTARRVELHSAVGNLFASGLRNAPGFRNSVPPGITNDVDRGFLLPTWQLSATMTQPFLFTRKNSLGVSVFSNRRIIPGIVIDRGVGASLTVTHNVRPDLPASLTYRYERARVEAGDLYFCVNFGYCRLPIIQALQQAHVFAPAVFTVRADRTDDPLEPKSGYTARIDAEYASRATGSDWRFHRLEAELTPYLKVGTRVLVIRAHAGRITALAGTNDALGVSGASGQLLHPRTRFYGGGARSVRGFAEGQLGPRVLTIDPLKLTAPTDTTRVGCTDASIADGSCDPNVASSSEFTPRPVGGNSILEGTIEYRVPMGRNTGFAVFVDAGHVGASNLGRLLTGRSAITPGAGFRYLSPIGPVRIDLGLRPNRAQDLPVMTQVRDVNGNLSLVELNTPKRFDPPEGRSGFLSGITSRLQLHIYIGEAY
ncbi:MAG TPA: BamA/TamA family outer membrane protein [Longimicrobiales bacterium]